MSNAAAATAPAKASPKKKESKPHVPAAHPKYCDMIKEAISSLKERGGSSRQAILKYIVKNFNVNSDESKVNSHLKLALRAGVKNNSLKNSKGSGASGSFKLGEAAKKGVKPKKVEKPRAAKPKKAKTPKKAKKPKEKTAKKTPKKATKKPKTDKPKKAISPKKDKTPKEAAVKPAKKAAAKKPAAKKATKKPAGKKVAK